MPIDMTGTISTTDEMPSASASNQPYPTAAAESSTGSDSSLATDTTQKINITTTPATNDTTSSLIATVSADAATSSTSTIATSTTPTITTTTYISTAGAMTSSVTFYLTFAFFVLLNNFHQR